MLSTSVAPQVRVEPAIKDFAVEDVTVVMPFYDRIKYLDHYINEGFWEGLPLQLVCDGPAPKMLQDVQHLVQHKRNVKLHSYLQNRGPAFARTTGINLTKTECISFCDDDDFLTDAPEFLNQSSKHLALHSDALFTTMPAVYAFNESLQHSLQYDRSGFHGKTGRELLFFLVKTGEMCALSVGTVFRTTDVKGIYPEHFFKVSEDYTFLTRLCARFPDRKVHVAEQGMYMRLVQTDSLSAKASYSLDKVVMHLVSMFVGAYYLFKMGLLSTPMFQQILLDRGRVLEQSYGKGVGATTLMAGMLEGKVDAKRSSEAQAALNFLQSMKSILPPEFLWLVGWNGQRLQPRAQSGFKPNI